MNRARELVPFGQRPGDRLPIEHRSGRSPLPYFRSGDVRRFALVSPALADVPFERGDVYFAETKQIHTRGASGRALKKPRVTIVPGAPLGTIAWVDWHLTGPDSIYVDFMNVRRDCRGRGMGVRLMDDFYNAVASRMAYVDWGRVLNPSAWAIYERERDRHPQIRHHAKVDF